MDVIIRDLDPVTGQHHDRLFQYHEIETEPIFRELIEIEKVQPCEILFLTGNKNKVIELEQTISSKYVKILPLDFNSKEIQDSEALDIVQHKCQQAFEHINKSRNHQIGATEAVGLIAAPGVDQNIVNSEQNNRLVLVEDTSLNFRALNGLPGPYIKWFMEAIGPAGLHKMLAGFEDKSAEAVCIYALMANKNRLVYFRGIARGRITEPRGSSWGWDPVFEEERSSLTFGEMDTGMKSKFSHRAIALTIFKKFLTILEERIKEKK